MVLIYPLLVRGPFFLDGIAVTRFYKVEDVSVFALLDDMLASLVGDRSKTVADLASFGVFEGLEDVNFVEEGLILFSSLLGCAFHDVVEAFSIKRIEQGGLSGLDCGCSWDVV